MALINSDVVPALPTGGYTIDQSLKIDNSPYDGGTNDGDEKKLTWSLGSDGNRKTWTVSFWFKGISEDNACKIFQCYDTTLRYGANGILYFISEEAGGNTLLYSSASFRDYSAWYHFVVSVDTTQSTASDRFKIYVNGERITDWSTEQYQGQDTNTFWNHHDSSFPMYWGVDKDGYSQELQAYLSEIHSIDGQQLDPTYFGETDETYGHWKPIRYSGSYGTKGYYLNFSNASSLGADSSGNGNNFTVSNLTANDQVLDSPTNNFATWNPLFQTSPTLSQGNLRAVPNPIAVSNFNIPTSGKWYAEFYCESRTASVSTYAIGIHETFRGTSSSWNILLEDGYGYYGQGRKYPFDTSVSNWSSYGATFDTGDIIGVLVDTTNNNLTFYKNGTSQGQLSYTARPSGVELMFAVNSGSGDGENTYVANFGQDSSFAGNVTAQGNTDDNGIGDFYYTPPSGYLALCTANLPDPAVIPSEHFNTVLYTGDGSSSRNVIGVGFDSDFVWIKQRSGSYSHVLGDAVRGDNVFLSSNGSGAEGTDSTKFRTFVTDGFQVGSHAGVNNSGSTYVGWNWKANGSGSSNTNGSVTTTVSANQDAGFSIFTATLSGSSDTYGHGLSQAPEFVMIKPRNYSNNWVTGNASLGWDYQGVLNSLSSWTQSSTGAFSNGTNAVAPTSTVMTIRGPYIGTGSNIVAYCFHSVDGFSKVGSYTGNGSSDGPFVYTGFRPACIIYKRTDSSADWHIYDNKRDTYNVADSCLFPSGSYNDQTGDALDFLSNGFKQRNTGSEANASGGSYIYIAFAKNPFKYTNAR